MSIDYLSFTVHHSQGGNLCVACIYYEESTDSPEDVLNLEKTLRSLNPSNRLFIIDILGRFRDELQGQPNYLYLPLPRKDYIWWQDGHYISEEGYAFMHAIAQSLLNFIRDNFEKKEGRRRD